MADFGLAQTNKFMLGTATVMLGAPADLFDLTPSDSIGLVKNFTISSDPAYTELTQGIKNQTVFSVMTANPCRATMEAFEFTAQNLGYALGLTEALSGLSPLSVTTATNGATASPTDIHVGVDSIASLAAGDYVMFDLGNDHVLVRKLSDASSGILTVTLAFAEVIPDNTPVSKVNMISGGSKEDQPFYSAKIVGKLADGEKVMLLLPKVRISKGFNMAFQSDQYGNLPIELTLYDLVNSDTFYTEFNGDQFRIFKAK